jgi:phage portal protein BeeE
VDLLDRPGPATSQADLISSLMSHLAIYGNGYVAKYQQGGEIVQLALLHPERMRPELESRRLVSGTRRPPGREQLLTTADLVHVKGLSVSGLVGLSAVSQALASGRRRAAAWKWPFARRCPASGSHFA